MADSMTQCGLPGINAIPYGLHACHFYRDRDHLVEALVPYFVAGLRNHERCLWITAPPLPAREALAVLEMAWGDDVRSALAKGALRVLDFDRWYAEGSRLKGVDVVEAWLEEEKRALAEGHRGLRIAGNTSFLHSPDWAQFMAYERAVTAGLYGRRIVALCSYALHACTGPQARQTVEAHNCAFERADSTWHVSSRS